MTSFRPIPPDRDLPEPSLLIASIGKNHLLVESVTTSAVEMMKNDGTDWYPGIIVEFEGRFNRTDLTGVNMSVLGVEAAVILYKGLQHSLGALVDAGLL